MTRLFVMIGLMGILAACSSQYIDPEIEGLNTLGPYPAADRVCEALGPSAATEPFEVPERHLIGCPTHETGAIKQQLEENATIVGKVGSWTILRLADGVIPQAYDVPVYVPPSEVGLLSIRPFPTARDVCVRLGASPAVEQYIDSGVTLLGCPTSEQGAIADRKKQGFEVVGTVESWTILKFPKLM